MATKKVIGSSNDYDNAAEQARRWRGMKVPCHIDAITLPSGQIIYEVIEDRE